MPKMSGLRLGSDFYRRDVLEVAPDLIGKMLVRKFDDGSVFRAKITEVEAYGGEDDLASHARFGKTKRNMVMYEAGGLVYAYFIYGMYWMLNVVTGNGSEPQAVLIRGVEGVIGPGRLGKKLMLDRSFYGEDLTKSRRIWIENQYKVESSLQQLRSLGGQAKLKIARTERIGVGYAGEWAKKKWRYVVS